MQRLINLTAIHSLIALPILVILLISPTSHGHSGTTLLRLPQISSILKSDNNALLSEPSGISNWQVHGACRDAIKGTSPEAKSLGQFVCRMVQDMVYEQNIYHQYFINYFTEKNMEEPLYIINGYSVTGCDVSELDRANFTAMIIQYFDYFEDELEDSFFWTLAQVLKPYCDELKDAAVEFHLDGRKS